MNITIPTEALEAAIKAFDESEEDAYVSHADDIRAACLAMLRNWPGVKHDPGALVTDTYRDPGKIILPLPQEPRDE